jgi:hypothetical protein
MGGHEQQGCSATWRLLIDTVKRRGGYWFTSTVRLPLVGALMCPLIKRFVNVSLYMKQ